jgi:hypothetical protein
MTPKFNDVAKVPYIPISPVALFCPTCGAKPGKACDMLRGEVELIHVDRIRAAARADAATRMTLGK